MKVYRDNIINSEAAFKFLARLDPAIALSMMRNRIVVISTSDNDKTNATELNNWIRENCEGLVYFINKSSVHEDHYVYQFEKPEEAVAFKLRWT